MEEIEINSNINSNNEIKLLNKKRNKNKSSKKYKSTNNENNDITKNETILEIKSLINSKPEDNLMELEKNEIIENKENKSKPINTEDILLLIKKTYINFNTPESLFKKGRKDPEKFPENEKYNTYYVQRYYFFSLYDEGIQMDQESWYSVTPEEISEYIASIIPDSLNSVILDAFCGCGGNVISLSKKFKKVIANDLFSEKINMTKNNTKIYNCPNNIIYYTQDFLKLNLNNEKVDYVFLSPPWGGPEYKNETIYSLKKWITPDIDKIIQKSFKISQNIILYLPRNTDLEELADIIYKYDKNNIESLSNTILLDTRFLNSASKIKGILVLYGPKFNSVKVKIIKQYLINSIFKKNSNKINQNKIKKQLNILKVIGYSDYIRNLVEFKKIKKDFSGNIFLENLEKYFVENVMDENEKIDYENMNKKNQEEYDLINLINGNKKNDLDKDKIEENNEFIDLRCALSEEKFKEAQKDIFFEYK